MKRLNLTLVLVALSCLVYLGYTNNSTDYSLVSTQGCCTIKVEQLTKCNNLVTYIEHSTNTQEARTTEPEYYDVNVNDYTECELSALNTQDYITQWQEYCYTNH